MTTAIQSVMYSAKFIYGMTNRLPSSGTSFSSYGQPTM
ncbi:MAG TPA: hypothetical protein [Caudoviricetes sp.]|nr:MAG TPA: hypothetical protein [Caudoviricetes sp.]